jgi:septum formation protein
VRLILASASPRRAELLRSAGYTFDVVVADVDESIREGESPATYVRRLAADKSAAALKRCATSDVAHGHAGVDQGHAGVDRGHARVAQGFSPAEAIILGADTTVVVDGEILGKPCDDDDARKMLRRLSGKTHQVLTGISLRRGEHEVGRVESTAVTFRALTDEDISWYVESGEGRDKAGGYAIQGLASRFIPGIAGSYANVVGLPVESVDELLRSLLASGRWARYSGNSNFSRKSL